MKLTTLQLRHFIRESVKRRVELLAEEGADKGHEQMIITKKILQQLIDEEFSRVTKSRQKKLNESFIGDPGNLVDVDISELIEFAKAYAGLGDAVQEQLDTILSGDEETFEDVNPNAIEMIHDELGGINSDIDTSIQAYNDWLEQSGSDRNLAMNDEF